MLRSGWCGKTAAATPGRPGVTHLLRRVSTPRGHHRADAPFRDRPPHSLLHAEDRRAHAAPRAQRHLDPLQGTGRILVALAWRNDRRPLLLPREGRPLRRLTAPGVNDETARSAGAEASLSG